MSRQRGPHAYTGAGNDVERAAQESNVHDCRCWFRIINWFGGDRDLVVVHESEAVFLHQTDILRGVQVHLQTQLLCHSNRRGVGDIDVS